MTPEEAFLQATLDTPDEDAPRLIYADWLEERGDPRGEFIRVQCALARPDLNDAGRAKLQAREQELLLKHGRDWLGQGCSPRLRWRFHRGLLAGLEGMFQSTRVRRYRDYLRFYLSGTV